MYSGMCEPPTIPKMDEIMQVPKVHGDVVILVYRRLNPV